MMEEAEAAAPGFGQRKKKQAEEKKKRIIPEGSVMKAIIRPGSGSAHPQDGDMLLFHCTTRSDKGVIVESSRSQHGGHGFPLKVVLGKSKIIAAWEQGIPSMLKGEVAMFRVQPQFHYGEENCPVQVPEDFPKDEELLFEIELIEFFKVKVVTEDLGVIKRELSPGEGWETAREPYEVKAQVTCRVCDGREEIFSEFCHFAFGKNEVPAGLEKGIGTMTKGEKAIIFVRKDHVTASPRMPQLQNVVGDVEFEVLLVQIVQVRDMMGDGKVIKRRIKDGTGEFPVDCPLQDSLLRIHYKGMLPDEGGRVFYDTRVDGNGEPLEFRSGEGMVPEGLEMCIRLMLPNEVALGTSTSEYAFDKFERPANVPEGATVQWEVELLGFEMPRDWTGLNFTEIMEEAENIKSTGNRLFKEGKYQLARAKYEKVLKDFNHVNPQDDEEGKIFAEKRRSLNLNMAACYQKLGDYKKCVETCNKVLDEHPGHVKALYRRGMAHMASGDFDEARNDFNKMRGIDKSAESDALVALAKLKKKEQEVEMRDRKQFKGLFDKKPGEIAEESKTMEEDSNDNGDKKSFSDNRTQTTEDDSCQPQQVCAGSTSTSRSSIFGYGKRALKKISVILFIIYIIFLCLFLYKRQ